MPTFLSRPFVVWTVCAALGLTLPASVEAGQREQAPPGVSNYTRIDAAFACSGATPVEAIPLLKQDGFRSIVNFRMPDEEGADIEASKAAADKAGVNYIHLPFRTPSAEVADAFLAAIANPANQPAYIHCGAANRAASMWLLKRLVVDGWDETRAVAEAEGLGMRTASLREFALQYARARR